MQWFAINDYDDFYYYDAYYYEFYENTEPQERSAVFINCKKYFFHLL